MIVTLTVNPALDRTILLEAPLRAGAVQAAVSAREDAGGKGINVARVLAAAGAETLAVLPLAEDDPLRSALTSSHMPLRTVEVGGYCRANIAITDPDGVTTKLNLPGPVLSSAEVSALTAEVVAATEGARWLVLAGSLPPGIDDDFYVTVIEAVRGRWGAAAPRIAVDASGAPLRAVVDRGRPDLIKPNDEELTELTGVVLAADDLARAALAAGRRLVPGQVAAALITLGGSGAVLVESDSAYVAVPPPIRVRSTVGAGDSSLAGYLVAEVAGLNPSQRLASAVRHGAAAASLPGTQVPAPSDLPEGDVAVAPLTL